MTHQDFLKQSIEELRLKTAAHDRLWHLGEADWSVDQDTGEIEFANKNGMVAKCSVQIIGTFDTTDSTWLWAWDHPSVQPPLRSHATRLLEYGEANKISTLTTRKLSATEDQCWEFTALACKLNDAQGGYRGPSGTTLVFMTFGEPQLSGDTTNNKNSGHVIPAENDTEPEFTKEIPDDIRDKVVGFITALRDWELASHDAYKGDDARKSKAFIRNSYADLIAKWCVEETESLPKSFGNPPNHCPDLERLVSFAPGDGQCRVRTRHTSSTGHISDYEYHLRRSNNRWLIANLFWLDGDEKFEML